MTYNSDHLTVGVIAGFLPLEGVLFFVSAEYHVGRCLRQDIYVNECVCSRQSKPLYMYIFYVFSQA